MGAFRVGTGHRLRLEGGKRLGECFHVRAHGCSDGKLCQRCGYQAIKTILITSAPTKKGPYCMVCGAGQVRVATQNHTPTESLSMETQMLMVLRMSASPHSASRNDRRENGKDKEMSDP